MAKEPGSKWVLLWGATWMCKVPLDGPNASLNRKRKKRSAQASKTPDGPVETSPHDGFKMITQYRPLMGVDFLSGGELVVIERPLVDVLANLPPAYFRYKYGAT